MEPGIDRLDDGSPVSPFLQQALIDENVGVDRHAHREHDAGNARQGQRGAERRQKRHEQMTFTSSAMFAITPRKP